MSATHDRSVRPYTLCKLSGLPVIAQCLQMIGRSGLSSGWQILRQPKNQLSHRGNFLHPPLRDISLSGTIYPPTLSKLESDILSTCDYWTTRMVCIVRFGFCSENVGTTHQLTATAHCFAQCCRGGLSSLSGLSQLSSKIPIREVYVRSQRATFDTPCGVSISTSPQFVSDWETPVRCCPW